ncbi:MAG: TetR/AcrR family transcriptional regulator [Lysobacter sp.]|nr:TetR/AcrR family transcriptional regulator [Lysobacter sp.]
MKAAKVAKVVRRRPTQARSQGTVDAIYEATLQIIEREGAERITTNRISEVSGFSIGTLYQYFHDRDSLLMAMGIAHRDRLIERLKTTLAASPDQASREAISRLVAVMVADARSNRKMLRAVVRAVTRKEMAARMLDAMRVLDRYIGRSLAESAGGDGLALSPACQFVLSRSLTCVLWSAVMEDSDLLDSQELEDQLRNMLAAAMIRGPESNVGHAAPNTHSAIVSELA